MKIQISHQNLEYKYQAVDWLSNNYYREDTSKVVYGTTLECWSFGLNDKWQYKVNTHGYDDVYIQDQNIAAEFILRFA